MCSRDLVWVRDDRVVTPSDQPRHRHSRHWCAHRGVGLSVLEGMTTDTVSSGLLPLVERGLYLNLPRRGVIHVGANDGAELVWYLDPGLIPMLCFEPNPEAFRSGLSDWGGSSAADDLS